MSCLPFIASLFARLKVMITIDVAEKFHLHLRIGRKKRHSDTRALPAPSPDGDA